MCYVVCLGRESPHGRGTLSSATTGTLPSALTEGVCQATEMEIDEEGKCMVYRQHHKKKDKVGD